MRRFRLLIGVLTPTFGTQPFLGSKALPSCQTPQSEAHLQARSTSARAPSPSHRVYALSIWLVEPIPRGQCTHKYAKQKGDCMKFFIDTADLDEIREALSWGCLAGVTTNPSLYARTGGKLADFEDHMVKIAKMCDGLPVSAESQAKTTEGMIEEGRHLASLAPNIVVKLPICAEALAATHTLAAEGVRINMTLIFSAPQALLAANAGARYVSPFVGRFDDIGEDGISELANVVTCIQNYDWTGKNVDDEVEIITASVRTPNHVTQAALMGADIATVPFGALKKCLKHPLTDQGMASFDADWAKVVAAQ